MILTSGCDLFQKKGSEAKKSPAVKVEVMKPVSRDVIDYEEFTGETDSVNNVNIQAQVSGTLTECSFTEGGEVQKDAVLFRIEPELYQAALDTARGNLARAEGELAALEAREPQYRNDKDRFERLLKTSAVSESEYDDALASYNECLAKIETGKAEILKAKAEVQEAEINLKYTKILSPIDGYISRKLVTEGNLIQPHSTFLAQIVSLDPIYVNFFVDETTYLRLVDLADAQFEKMENAEPAETEKDAAATEKVEKQRPDELKIEFHLTNEASYVDADGKPLHTGMVRYTDPSMDQSSGTVLLRATCANPKPKNGVINRIIPGMIVHIRIPVTEKYAAMLVPEEALGTEQGLRYIYVVDADGKAQMRHLELGPLQPDNMRVIRKGLAPTDTIIVSGLLRLRPGVEVNAKETTLEALREGI